LKTITRRQCFIRYWAVSIAVVSGSLLTLYLAGESGFMGAIVTGLVLIIWNSTVIASRQAFTQAIKEMKPLSRVDDDTLFPEEIDPHQARPSGAGVFHAVSIHGLFCVLIGGAVFFVMMIVNAVQQAVR